MRHCTRKLYVWFFLYVICIYNVFLSLQGKRRSSNFFFQLSPFLYYLALFFTYFFL